MPTGGELPAGRVGAWKKELGVASVGLGPRSFPLSSSSSLAGPSDWQEGATCRLGKGLLGGGSTQLMLREEPNPVPRPRSGCWGEQEALVLPARRRGGEAGCRAARILLCSRQPSSWQRARQRPHSCAARGFCRASACISWQTLPEASAGG